MRLRPHRRNLVVWSSSACPAGRYGALRFTRPGPDRRIRRSIRTGALLTVIGLVRLARAMRARWRPLLSGTVLTVAGFIMRSGMGSVVLIPGILLLFSALLVPPDPEDHERLMELERELAAYSTPAQRRDLEAILDRYPDGATHEVRDILARQAEAAGNNRSPAAGRC